MQEDRDILELFKVEGHEEEAFNLLVRRYGEKLYWHIRQMVYSHDDADDILQMTYLKVWNSLAFFRGASSLYTWLYRIATNESLSFLKSKRITSVFSLSSYSNIMASMVDDDSGFDGDAAQKKLYRAIAKLPDKQRAVFIMKYMEEMKYEEISAIMGVSVGALKAQYHHACEKIKKNIEFR